MTLDEFVQERRFTPFEYFKNDCAHIASAWVLDQRGYDPLEPLRIDGVAGGGSLLKILRAVQDCGGFVECGDRYLQLGEHKPGLMAQRGDIVVTRTGRKPGRVSGYAYGVCVGSHIILPGDNGLEFLPLTDGVAAWAV